MVIVNKYQTKNSNKSGLKFLDKNKINVKTRLIAPFEGANKR